MEVALDIALQCSPDHPWVTAHPEWFTTRADGTIAYAENPPKKYQDIYPLNFDNDPEGIYTEIRRVLQVWIDHGVTLFRVDNPHTKPLDFWERILGGCDADHPDVIFLSEAFTRPAMMQTLAKIGFHQSYTYFTWRNTKDEIDEYLAEVSGEQGAWMRPELLADDARHPAAVPAATAASRLRGPRRAGCARSPTWGIYSGYELVEDVPRPGRRGADRQREVRVQAPRLGERRRHRHEPACSAGSTSSGARTPRCSSCATCACTRRPTTRSSRLSPSTSTPSTPRRAAPTPSSSSSTSTRERPREAPCTLDLDALGLRPGHGPFVAHDVLSDETYAWGQSSSSGSTR